MSYSIISKHRSKIMAIAMIWIAFFHSTFWFNNRVLSFIQTNGFGGVDIFIFLFGFGMYYSLSKNDIDYITFYKKRLSRILPYVIPVLVIYCIYESYDLYKSTLYISLLDFWINGNTILWYFPALIGLILISPFYYSLYKTNRKLAIIISLLVSFLSFIYFKNTTQMVFGSRIPVFFLGFVYGELSSNKKSIKLIDIVIHLLCLSIGLFVLYFNYHHFSSLMWSHGLYWYPFILIAPGMSFILSLFFDVFSSNLLIKNLSIVLNKLGQITMEFYLFHELLIKMLDSTIRVPHDINRIFRNIIIFTITLLIAFVYHYTIKYIKNTINI